MIRERSQMMGTVIDRQLAHLYAMQMKEMNMLHDPFKAALLFRLQ